MRVLFLSPLSNIRCGERVYGEIWAGELRKVGVEVVEYDGWYPAAKEHGYFPYEDLGSYDLIHVNWGPANMGHYLPEHFPSQIPLSVFLHDVPPNSTCLLAERADLKISHEPMEGARVIDHAVPRAENLPEPNREFTVGVTGIRNDPGHQLVRMMCEREGWRFSAPGWWDGTRDETPFLPWEEEIRRLARSTVNVCWYQTSGRGKSMGAMFCVASGRPLVLSGSSMFSVLEDSIDQAYPHPVVDTGIDCAFTHDIYHRPNGHFTDLRFLADVVKWAAAADAAGVAQVAEMLSWEKCALKIKSLWEEAVSNFRRK